MSENTSQEVNDQPEGVQEPKNEVVQEREYSDVEKRALEQGWVPEEDFQGTGKWRSAEEFLDRGELFSKIDDISRRNKSLESALTETRKHLKKVRETEYNRALASLKAAKKDALDVGDSERVIEIDEQIASTKQEAAQELQKMDQPAPVPAAKDPVFVIWENKNPWYNQDRAMKVYADSIGEELVLKHGMNNPRELLQEIERRVKKEFAHKFENPNRAKPGAVEGVGSKGNGGRASSTFQLTAEETQVMNKLVRHGVMTKEEYIADIKASRGV